MAQFCIADSEIVSHTSAGTYATLVSHSLSSQERPATVWSMSPLEGVVLLVVVVGVPLWLALTTRAPVLPARDW